MRLECVQPHVELKKNVRRLLRGAELGDKLCLVFFPVGFMAEQHTGYCAKAVESNSLIQSQRSPPLELLKCRQTRAKRVSSREVSGAAGAANHRPEPLGVLRSNGPVNRRSVIGMGSA
jgi:hypothetical protein